jgi:hypothetical protein
MSERSIYLRDQADKCRRHANAMSDAQTQEELRKLAGEYVVRAAAIENQERTDSQNNLDRQAV